MSDYELGRLAEELIEKRYSDKLDKYEQKSKTDESRIAELENTIEELESGKIYCKEMYYARVGGYLNCNITYKSIDDITEELKTANETIEKLNKELGVVAKVNTKLDRFIHRNKLSTLIYKGWSK